MTPEDMKRGMPPGMEGGAPKRPDMPPSASNSNKGNIGMKGNNNDEKIAFSLDIGKLFQHPKENLGTFIFYGLVVSALLGAITGALLS